MGQVPVSWNLLVSYYEKNIAQLFLLQIIFHFAECLLCVVCRVEVLLRAIGVHAKQWAAGCRQPVMKEHIQGLQPYKLWLCSLRKFCSKGIMEAFTIIKAFRILVLLCLLTFVLVWYLQIFICKTAYKFWGQGRKNYCGEVVLLSFLLPTYPVSRMHHDKCNLLTTHRQSMQMAICSTWNSLWNESLSIMFL